MPMPKASVNEDSQLVLRKIEIGSARDVAPVQPKPKPRSVQRASHAQFRSGVTAPNAAHVFAPRSWAQMVCHYEQIVSLHATDTPQGGGIQTRLQGNVRMQNATGSTSAHKAESK